MSQPPHELDALVLAGGGGDANTVDGIVLAGGGGGGSPLEADTALLRDCGDGFCTPFFASKRNVVSTCFEVMYRKVSGPLVPPKHVLGTSWSMTAIPNLHLIKVFE